MANFSIQTKITSQEHFDAQCEDLYRMFEKGYLVTSSLEFVHKKSWEVVLLGLLQPFYRWMGKDAFSHMRIERVAEVISQFCQDHLQYMNPHSKGYRKLDAFLFRLAKRQKRESPGL